MTQGGAALEDRSSPFKNSTCVVCAGPVDPLVRPGQPRFFCNACWDVARREMGRAKSVRRTEGGYRGSHRARAERGGGIYEKVIAQDVYERDEWACQVCGWPVDPDLTFPDPWSKSLDHLIPLARGGDHAMDNCQLAHFRCNSQKGDR